jgi:cyclohexanecarboxylate-CoA ligase
MLHRPPPRNAVLETSYRAAGYWLREGFFHFFAATCKRLADRQALIDGTTRLTFGEIAARVERVARGLSSAGVRPGTVVAVQLPNWWETVVAYWAVIRLGAVLNPILPAYREREVEFILREGGAEVLFVPGVFRGFDHKALAERVASRTPSLRVVVVVRDEPAPGQIAFDALRGTGELPAPPRGEDVLLLMYTSGTTADPKGVIHSHETLLYEVRSLERVHSLTENDVTLMPSPLTHVSGLLHAALVPFVIGTRAVLMDQWRPDHALDEIAREAVTYMVGAPVFLSDLASHPRVGSDPPVTLRLFSCGGAGVSPELMIESRARLGCVSKRVYGSTEMPTLTTTSGDDPPERSSHTEGRAIWAAELRIVDDEDRDLPTGREGEILARGPDCFLGYRSPALDTEAFAPGGWFRTGDLGVVDASGYLTVTGRKKDIVIRKGEKVSAAEVEAAVARHPAVADVAVIALPDPATGERACACVITRPGMPLTLAELCDFLRAEGFPAHKLPEALEIVRELPRTASGKVQKHLLRDTVIARRG